MFREKRFHIRKIDEIFKDIDVQGILPASRDRFLATLRHAIANHPVTEQEVLVTTPW
jgi:hypothetical protein